MIRYLLSFVLLVAIFACDSKTYLVPADMKDALLYNSYRVGDRIAFIWMHPDSLPKNLDFTVSENKLELSHDKMVNDENLSFVAVSSDQTNWIKLFYSSYSNQMEASFQLHNSVFSFDVIESKLDTFYAASGEMYSPAYVLRSESNINTWCVTSPSSGILRLQAGEGQLIPIRQP